MIITNLTAGIFHPVRHQMLVLFKKNAKITSKDLSKIMKMNKKYVCFHMSYLLEYKLVKEAGWKVIKEEKKSVAYKEYELSEKGLETVLKKAEKMIKQLRRKKSN